MRKSSKRITFRPSYTPTALGSRLALWLDADIQSKTLIDGLESQWRDKSSRGIDLSQSVDIRRPLSVANGLNGLPISRNVSDDRLLTGTVDVLRNVAGATLMLVVKYPVGSSFTTNATGLGVAVGSGSARLLLSPNTGTPSNRFGIAGRRLDSDASIVAVASSTSSLDFLGSWVIQRGNADYINARANHWTNGTKDIDNVAFRDSGLTSNTSSQGVSTFSFFNATNLTPNGTEIAAAFIIDSSLSAMEGEKLEAFAAFRFDLVSRLPVNHPYKNRKPRK